MKQLLTVCVVRLIVSSKLVVAELKVTTDFPGGSAVVKSVDSESGVVHITPAVRSERG